jgi:hypothetical protein
LTAPIGQWLRRSFVNTYGKDPVQIRMMGGTVPTGVAVGALNGLGTTLKACVGLPAC